jgi:hypothetical protein
VSIITTSPNKREKERENAVNAKYEKKIGKEVPTKRMKKERRYVDLYCCR